MINQSKNRLNELESYEIMDTPPEEELDEITTIASAICDTPISLISLLDEKRQWFKSKKGLSVNETPIEHAFCRFTLDNPKEVLVIEDSLRDDRVKDNPLVKGEPNIRFYAGAPLVTPLGNVLGTICIIDKKPRKISENQKNALKLLAKKTMDCFNLRKIIREQEHNLKKNTLQLHKLTYEVPGVIFQCNMNDQGQINFPFISKELSYIHPALSTKKIRKSFGEIAHIVHPGDLNKLKAVIEKSKNLNSNIDIDFRIILGENEILWYRGMAQSERLENGAITWYGTIQDITARKKYEQALEQMSFDISHVLRKPISTMQGLTNLIQKENLDEKLLKKYTSFIKIVSDELDSFSRRLNKTYQNKTKNFDSYYTESLDN